MNAQTQKKRLAALLGGVAVAAAVVGACGVALPAQASVSRARDYGYVYSGAKSTSVDFVRANLDDETLLVLGSSEFSTPASTVPQVPAAVMGGHNYGLRLMLVGEAFDQCLWDAMALGALADGGLPHDRVALIVGLGMFTDGGLDNATFQERFSFPLYRGFMANPALPAELKQKLRARLAEQGVDEATLRAGQPGDPIAAIDGAVLGWQNDLRLRQQLMEVRDKSLERAQEPAVAPDWDALMADAYATAQQMSTTNDWGAEDKFYTTQLAPALDSLAGARAGETYSNTPEYDDLELFLQVCDACGVAPLVMIEPVMGPYYDHIGIDAATRASAYDRIRNVVWAHPNARLVDYSDREYEPYFLFDIVHFGWTGWIEAQHALYDFGTEGA